MNTPSSSYFIIAVLGAFIWLLSLRRLVSHRWVQKLVLRGYYIKYDPVIELPEFNGLKISDPVTALLHGEPKYAVILGRPAGITNFLREGIGLSRRFEFVLSKRQAIVHVSSFSRKFLHCSKLTELNSITVSQERQNPAILALWTIGGTFLLAIAGRTLFGVDKDFVILYFLLVGAAAAYYYMVCKITLITFSEGGNSAIRFAVHPAILERISGRSDLDLPLEEANKIAHIFRALKDG